MYKPTIQCALLVLTSLSLYSCNENLPTYAEPKDFLHGSIRYIPLPDVQYSHSDVNDITKTTVSFFSPPQIFFVDIISMFDETIQDKPEISGTMELICDDAPTANVTLIISQSNLASLQYNPTTQLLTLDPGDTVKLRVSWQYKTNDGMWGFQKADIEDEYADASGRFAYRIHKPLNYRVMVKVKLFKQVAPLSVAPAEFTIKFTGRIVFPG